jgi:23S rRNA pseudouridine1911/1915/1917 synthase
VTRAYQAVIWGVPQPRQGEIEGNIGRNPQNRKKMAVVNFGGKWALTRYRVIRVFGQAASVIECRLATGRTHQIRVHLTSKGHPLIGDPVYGGIPKTVRAIKGATKDMTAIFGFSRQALHAFLLGFTHPKTQERLEFKSEIPQDITRLISDLESVCKNSILD